MCPEIFYQKAIVAHLSMTGFSVREEFPYGRRRFDAVAYNGCTLIGVEVKCSNWRRAIQQARYHGLCCDIAAVALPANKVSAKVLAEAAEYGLGVIAIDGPPVWGIDWRLEARPSSPVQAHRQRLLEIGGWSNADPKY